VAKCDVNTNPVDGEIGTMKMEIFMGLLKVAQRWQGSHMTHSGRARRESFRSLIGHFLSKLMANLLGHN